VYIKAYVRGAYFGARGRTAYELALL